MLIEIFASRSNTRAFPFTITADSGEQGQNASLVMSVSGVVVYALIYVGF